MDNKAAQPDPDLIAKANEQQTKENLKRARVTAVVFGVITGLALITLVYGFVQKELADERSKEIIWRENQIDSLKVQLQNCNKQVKGYIDMNRKNTELAEQMLREAKEKLKNAKKK